MKPPKNLKLLLYDRFEPTGARAHLLNEIPDPEAYTLLETRTIGSYHRVRYASGSGIGDHVILGLDAHNDRWRVVGGILNRRAIPGVALGEIKVFSDQGIRQLKQEYSIDAVLSDWHERVGMDH